MTGILASPAALTTADRCDRCGAAAMVRAVLPTGGELLFCNHHATEHSARLEQLGCGPAPLARRGLTARTARGHPDPRAGARQRCHSGDPPS